MVLQTLTSSMSLENGGGGAWKNCCHSICLQMQFLRYFQVTPLPPTKNPGSMLPTIHSGRFENGEEH